MKNLFSTSNEEWNADALGLDREIIEAVKPIIQKYLDAGFTIRESCHVAMMSLVTVELDLLSKKRRQKKDPA